MGNFNRYNTNATRQTYQGRSYHSKAEAAYAMYLDQLLKTKQIKSWKPQHKIELRGENGGLICNYYIDFLVELDGGVTELVEVKGFPTDIWEMKWKLLNDKYGKNSEYKITLVKV